MMNNTGWAAVLFWTSCTLLLYTYLGYPVLLAVISRLRPRPVRRSDYEPTVSLIITAYNEERDLAAKLENTLSLQYPGDKLEIIVASDCSTDSTDDIAREFAPRGVQLHRQQDRMGKTAAQNAAVELAQGEIILFSDATTLYRADVLRALMPNFADPTVGCVAGKLIYVDPERSNVGRGARSYWSYETFLKVQESRIGSLIGVSGCLYAVRRSAYRPLYHEACSDFLIATKMVEQGLRAVYEPGAICTEEANRRTDRELRMRIRIIAQTYSDLWRHRHVLNPLRSGFFGVQLLSHKVLRYLVPFFFAATFLGAGMLSAQGRLYRGCLLADACLCCLAALGWMLDRAGFRSAFLALPQYFLLTSMASVIAAVMWLRGERYARWEPIRDGAQRSKMRSSPLPQRKTF